MTQVRITTARRRGSKQAAWSVSHSGRPRPYPIYMVHKLISGGQTGVDRAALDVALELGIPCGGWCPQGRRAEDGPIADRYPLQETPWWGYPQRTEWNVRDADGTLILVVREPDGGTKLTEQLARQLGKPCLVLNFDEGAAAEVSRWLAAEVIGVLNVAGPRESSTPGIYERARTLLREVLAD